MLKRRKNLRRPNQTKFQTHSIPLSSTRSLISSPKNWSTSKNSTFPTSDRTDSSTTFDESMPKSFQRISPTQVMMWSTEFRKSWTRSGSSWRPTFATRRRGRHFDATSCPSTTWTLGSFFQVWTLFVCGQQTKDLVITRVALVLDISLRGALCGVQLWFKSGRRKRTSSDLVKISHQCYIDEAYIWRKSGTGPAKKIITSLPLPSNKGIIIWSSQHWGFSQIKLLR